ncbi:MAG: PTS sugar transporter subunit IIA [Micrococcales bacterium]|nr:PTS sugar transporter subunit IIA [Micrococcales bacterium]
MPLPPIPDAAVRLQCPAADWREAVRLAGGALEDAGATTAAYADEMVRMIEEHGPYVVVSPGLALAHARPGPSVLADGLSVVTLERPVVFGHPHNDPVRVVLGLAVHSPERHLGLIADLANAFDVADTTARLAAAADADAVRGVLGAVA